MTEPPTPSSSSQSDSVRSSPSPTPNESHVNFNTSSCSPSGNCVNPPSIPIFTHSTLGLPNFFHLSTVLSKISLASCLHKALNHPQCPSSGYSAHNISISTLNQYFIQLVRASIAEPDIFHQTIFYYVLKPHHLLNLTEDFLRSFFSLLFSIFETLDLTLVEKNCLKQSSLHIAQVIFYCRFASHFGLQPSVSTRIVRYSSEIIRSQFHNSLSHVRHTRSVPKMFLVTNDNQSNSTQNSHTVANSPSPLSSGSSISTFQSSSSPDMFEFPKDTLNDLQTLLVILQSSIGFNKVADTFQREFLASPSRKILFPTIDSSETLLSIFKVEKLLSDLLESLPNVNELNPLFSMMGERAAAHNITSSEQYFFFESIFISAVGHMLCQPETDIINPQTLIPHSEFWEMHGKPALNRFLIYVSHRVSSYTLYAQSKIPAVFKPNIVHTQYQLLKETLDYVQDEHGSAQLAFFELFYGRLFQSAPNLQKFFRHTSDKSQYEKLFHVLRLLVEHSDPKAIVQPEAMGEKLGKLGRLHAKLGIKPSYFPIFRESLLYAFTTYLGPSNFSPEHRIAWATVFDEASGIMAKYMNPTKKSLWKRLTSSS